MSEEYPTYRPCPTCGGTCKGICEKRIPRITGETTLAELQRLFEKNKVRFKLVGLWPKEHKEAKIFFGLDDFGRSGSPFPSGVAVLNPDLAAALDSALYWDIEVRSK